ncbi:hypothetical protein FGO68_gene468 [Halteria grandinella]|uniref:Uncharacterized protein n=1 Tax=Halteria grandinella TaxID=5974 RepID=A0A8J8P8R3_HALGN|nr:hypothetical protein FGO68_gene468 [Halteria grandinella]
MTICSGRRQIEVKDNSGLRTIENNFQKQLSEHQDLIIPAGQDYRITTDEQQNGDYPKCLTINILPHFEVPCKFAKDRVTLEVNLDWNEAFFGHNEINLRVFGVQGNLFLTQSMESGNFLYRPVSRQLVSTSATISAYSALVTPTSYTLGATTTYTITFVPANYKQGMSIQLTLPSQLSLPTTVIKKVTTTATLTCIGLYGTDSTTLTCSGNYTTRKVTITGAFNSTSTSPANISFSIASVINTATSTTTDSFTLETYSGTTLLDSISTFLTVSFNCTSPCKTCDSTGSSVCTSCQGLSSYPYLSNSTCIATCPSAYFADASYSCVACSSPCLTCSGSASSCLSCVDGYTLSGDSCSNYDLYTSQYYFFASGMGVAVSIVMLLFKCCCKRMKWLDSTISWVSLSEIISWGALLYLYYNQTDFIHIITLGAACAMHVVMNLIYAITHQKLVFKEGGAIYKQLVMNYHCWNTLAVVISFLLTFKFHIIQMSHFWHSTALGGDWPKEVWGVWNMVVVMYLFSCYSILVGSSAYFVLKHLDNMEEWIFWATCDVAALSTYVAFLLIISACCQGTKKSHQEIDNEVAPQPEDNSLLQNRSRRGDEDQGSGRSRNNQVKPPPRRDSSNTLEESGKQLLGKERSDDTKTTTIPPPVIAQKQPPPPPPRRQDPIPPPQKPIEHQSMDEIKDAVRKMPLVNHVPPSQRGILRNKAQFGPPLPAPKSRLGDQSNNNSARVSPPPTSDDMRKAAFPPASKKAPMPPHERNPFPPPPKREQTPPKKFEQEMDVLKQYMDYLKGEKQMMRDERHEMIRERQKILDQELLRQKEFMFMQRQMTNNNHNDNPNTHKLELENMKLKFMLEMDKTLKERLGDGWDRKSKDSKKHRRRDYSISETEEEEDDTPPRDKRGNRSRRERTPPKKDDRRGTKSNPRGGKLNDSMYTYSYSPEVSLYDKGMQTELPRKTLPQKGLETSGSNLLKPKLNQSFEDSARPSMPPSKHSQEIQVSDMTQLPSEAKLPPPPIEPPVKPTPRRGVEINIQTDPIKPPTPPKGPIYGNRPIYIHVNCQADEETEEKVPLPKMVKPLPSCNYVEMSAEIEEVMIYKEEEEKALDPISSRNNPLFKIQSEQMPSLKRSEYQSQLEPIQENHPLNRVVSGPFNNPSDQVIQQSEMMEVQDGENKPFYSKAQPSGLADGELNMSQMEPIMSNNPLKSNIGAQGIDRSINDSMFEAVRENNPLYEKATPNSKLQGEVLDSQIEPIVNKAIFNRATPFINDRSVNESFIEPLDENKPYFQDVTPSQLKEVEEESQMIEPIEGNEALKKDVSGLLQDVERDEEMIEPIGGNEALKKDVSGQLDHEANQDEDLIEPITENKPLFDTQEEKKLEKSESQQQIEPISGNLPEFDDIDQPLKEVEANDAQIQPIQENLPLQKVTSDKDLQRESHLRQSMVEPIDKAIPLSKDVSDKDLPKKEENHESLVEPIPNEPALRDDASDEAREEERYESIIEPIETRPLNGGVSDKSIPREEQRDESLIEPVKGNSALRDQVSDVPLSNNMRESMIEPIVQVPALLQDISDIQLDALRQESQIEPFNNSPEFGLPDAVDPPHELYQSQIEPIPRGSQMFQRVPSSQHSRQMNHSQIEPVPRQRPLYRQASRSTMKESSVEQYMQVEPVFEVLPPQDQSKEDIEIHHTEAPLRSDLSKRPIAEPEPEEEEEPVQQQAQPIARKIKKILYSDKSESSLDERMEDTPSNYNIPNGRLDGRSLGLKAIMMREKKKARKQLPEIPENSAQMGRTLQPVSSGKLSSSKKSQLEGNHQYFSPIRGTIQGPSQPSLLKNSGPDKVNNLFQDQSEIQIQTVNQAVSRQRKGQVPGSRGQRFAPPSQEGDTGGQNSSLMNRKRAEALDLNQNTEYHPTFGAGEEGEDDPTDNRFFQIDTDLNNNAAKYQIGGGAGTGMIAKKQKRNAGLSKGLSKKQFKERSDDANPIEGGANISPPPEKRMADIGPNPYSIKTTLPKVSMEPPKISFKR